uniref:C2H2-type domain-containing protein n=1 Tax=Cacopsylla melanoneura TaxID=428564 RepID=A0A8D8M767_9HEMI
MNSRTYRFIFSLTDVEVCQFCHEKIPSNPSFLLDHCKSCKNVIRPNIHYKFVCLVYNCEYYTQNSCHIKNHINMHCGFKPFTCPLCSRAFTTKSNLQVHLKTQHI